MPSLTISQYLVEMIKSLDVQHVFGVPGDFSFAITDAICRDKALTWIGCANELNASYAADGYARAHGISVLSTTYGPGELSAYCGIAGAYSANLPVIFIVGMPSSALMQTQKLVHHTLGTGQFDTFSQMIQPITGAHTVLTADNAIQEIQRVFHRAIVDKRPVYIGVPEDIARLKINVEQITLPSLPMTSCDENALDALSTLIADKINQARQPILMLGDNLRVYHALHEAKRLVNEANLPFATMFADKGILDETHPNFLGLYDGRVINRPLREYIESSDCVVNLGALLTDFNTGGFTANWPKNTVMCFGDRIEYDAQCRRDVPLQPLIAAIIEKVEPRPHATYPHFIGLAPAIQEPDAPITSTSLYPRWEQFFQEGDQIIAETGTISMGLGMAKLPANVTFENQTLWGSIGWATPAALGAMLAKPEKRTILLTGEGSHQLTVQAIGQFYRYGQKPIVFVLNNNGYLIERLLCEDPFIDYNDICTWEYSKLPEAFGVQDWYCARVTTNAELDRALEIAQHGQRAVYIEVMTSDMDTPPLAANLAAQLNQNRGLPVHVAPIAD